MDEMIKVLYVDDEPINLMLFQRIFGKRYEVKTADSGFKGLEMLEQMPDIKIVISDMKMPNMDGLEFAKIATNASPGIKFFILTGFGITSEILDAMESNLIYHYFQKPFKTEDIDNAIKSALADLSLNPEIPSGD